MQACVLLVDDEPQVTQGLQMALRHEPFRIITAQSASQALERLAAGPVDVVISDERMPGMGGTDLLTEVRRRWPGTLRMLLTGQTSMEMVIRAINEGKITHFFSKPCQAAEVAQVVRQALRLRDLEADNDRLARTNRQQATLLERLETAHPGITSVRRSESGAVLLEDE